MKRLSILAMATAAAACTLAIGVGNAASPETSPGVKDGTIGFVLTSRYWAVHQSPEGKVECPKGFNDGPREQG